MTCFSLLYLVSFNPKLSSADGLIRGSITCLNSSGRLDDINSLALYLHVKRGTKSITHNSLPKHPIQEVRLVILCMLEQKTLSACVYKKILTWLITTYNHNYTLKNKLFPLSLYQGLIQTRVSYACLFHSSRVLLAVSRTSSTESSCKD